MEEDAWVVVSSCDESYDSDKVDSDIEAELYSIIHHEADTSPVVGSCQSIQSNFSAPFNANGSLNSNTCNLNHKAETSQDISVTLSPRTMHSKSNGASKENSFVDSKPSGFVTLSQREPHTDSDDEVMILTESNSNCRKRKSNLSESNKLKNSKDTNGTSSASLSKKQRISNAEDSERITKFTSNKADHDFSSDSDSIIWTDVDESKLELQTNVGSVTLDLSSDSFSDEDFNPFLDDSSFRKSFKSTLTESASFTGNFKDPWYINAEDLYRTKKGSRRYHEQVVLNCTNCNLKGHVAKFCSVPKSVKCYICGGAHMGSRCNYRICYKCYRAGHDSKFCNQRIVDICDTCNRRGHSTNHCPDLWRRYHFTTTQKRIMVPAPIAQDTPIYCFNCGDQGHYGSVCNGPRSDRSHMTWTSVISYVPPKETIMHSMNMRRDAALGGIPVWINRTPNMPQLPMNHQLIPQLRKHLNHQLIPRLRAPVNHQLTPQLRAPVNRQLMPQMQQLAKKKKNKKKKKLNKSMQSPGNKTTSGVNSTSQTPESGKKTNNQKEANFPRISKRALKRRAKMEKLKRKSVLSWPRLIE